MRELERDLPEETASLDAGPGSLPELTIVGAGRMGGAMARAARLAGLRARLVTREEFPAGCRGASAVLLCVPDDGLAEVAAALATENAPEFVGHTSGVHGLDALASLTSAGTEAFAIHPLQTVPSPDAILSGAPAAIAGSTAAAERLARRYAEELGLRPFLLPRDARTAYHAAAAMASNFLVTLEESAATLLERAGVSEPARDLLAPLVLRTAANWAENGSAALTGPIARGDLGTVAAHRRAIAETAPELAELYDALAARTEAIACRGVGRAEPGRPEVIRTLAGLRAALEPNRRAGRSVALVPTMGSLHAGHVALLRAARRTADVVVMSLFVNPAQFGPGEDLDAYPRDEPRDVEIAGGAGVDIVYAPSVDEVYPAGFATTVEVAGGLTEVLCGAPERRGPAHFRGVTTVVAKLLGSIGPDIAFFGQKDAQQAIVVRRMVRDLGLPVRIEVVPTVREPDGLAMSSRNAYLAPDERRRAAAISRALERAHSLADSGETRAAALVAAARDELVAAGIEPEYVELRDAEDLTEVENLTARPALLAVAARVGRARLIDNTVIGG